MVGVAILCAVLAAGCGALGAMWQHAGVRETTDLKLTSALRLVRSRRWVHGFLVLFACAVLQVVALALAPVSVVAPLNALAIPIIAVARARRPTGVPAVAALVATAGIAVFVTITAGAAVPTQVSPKVALQAAQLVVAGVLVCVVAATFTAGAVRALALAVGAGIAYGLVAVLVRDVTTALPVVEWVSLGGLVVAFLSGAWFIQLGYAAGPPDLVVAGQTVVNPIVAAWIGIELLGEGTGMSAVAQAGLVVSAVAAVAGTVALAHYHHVRQDTLP
ncbi:DMT family transporter [Lentzea sp. DG1S-22]|uniref:DMT family transporter n=1 Tax=Lentzea sp. DG1S-22 TaxID=3108822 RepID=UPI002E776DCD|nr:DMT family transporter [Lentzea sp. DG1S-22]WVH81243.1 DMT family transporter [Lentzea sp. DG1S-22]